MSLEFTASEMMSVTAARALTSDMTCFVGIGLPSEAANLARLTHAQRRKAILKENPSIKQLEGCSVVNSWGVGLGVGCILLQIGCAWLASHSWTACLMLAATIGPYIDATVLAIMHEATHFLIFPQWRPLNRFFSIGVNLVMVMPISEIFRQHHWQHHLGLGDPVHDVDIPFPFEVNLVGNKPGRKLAARRLGTRLVEKRIPRGVD